MSFYTALTGLNGSQSDISATSNNIANVGTTGFKRSRAEFGDIFATSPLQNASSSIGSGTILKGIKQQFTQGNISSSLIALDLAISGQGFFALKPSLTSAQTVYTRNGSLNVNNDRYVVDSAGQYLLVFPVNNDGSVTAKDIISASPLQLPVTSGEPQATNNIQIGVNVPAGAEVVTPPGLPPSLGCVLGCTFVIVLGCVTTFGVPSGLCVVPCLLSQLRLACPPGGLGLILLLVGADRLFVMFFSCG